jgi:soluble lytic murein transglycosylase-like protein
MTRLVVIALCIFAPAFSGLSRADVELYQTYMSRYAWLDYHVYTIAAEQAARHNLRLDLVLAVIDAESGGNTMAVSRTGARGLLQVMARHWYDGNERDLHIPRVGIQRGCVALKWAHDVARGDLVLTLRNYERGSRGRGINVSYVLKIFKNLDRGAI